MHNSIDTTLPDGATADDWSNMATAGTFASALPLVWQHFCRKKTAAIPPGALKLAAGADFEDVLSALLADTIQVKNVRALKSSKRFSGARLHRLIRLLDWLTAPDFALKMTASAITDDCLTVPSISSEDDSLLTCTESYFVSGTNVLRFFGGGESMFLLQNVTSADAIYLPEENLLLLHCHTTKEHLAKCIAGLLQLLPRALPYANGQLEEPGHWAKALRILRAAPCRPSRHFAGLIAGHSRPYHFYYDVVPIVGMLASLPEFAQMPGIFGLAGGDFMSLKGIFDLHCPAETLAARDFNDRNFRQGTFMCRAGMPFREGFIPDLTTTDDHIRHHAEKTVSSTIARPLGKAADCFPLIWIGLTGQKRLWREQTELAGILYSRWHKAFPRLGFVFDGWTTPLTGSSHDLAEIKADQEVMRQSQQLLPADLPCFPVIGLPSSDKLAFARISDVAVTNASAGNIHIVRLARRPAVGHISNRMTRFRDAYHVQYDTIQVPPEAVTDLPESEHTRADHVDYSINPVVVADLATPLLDALDADEARRRRESTFAALTL